MASNTNENEQELNTETKEATFMRADMEVIGVSGLQKQEESFHAKGAAAARIEVENRMTETTEAKYSKGLATGTINGQIAIKDSWDSDELEEESIMDGNEGKTEELADDEACDTTDNPEIGGISLFGVGGKRNLNQQKDRTNIITSSLIESTEEEQEHVIASLVTKSVLNILDDESLDDNDNDNDNNNDNDDE